jgi:deferrochelatase/peroxidase EfeB
MVCCYSFQLGVLILTSTGISITETDPSKLIAPQSKITPESKIDFSVNDTTKNVCPFAAHIRKTAPRDNDSIGQGHHIMRRGIQFGDEVRSGETQESDFLNNGFLDYSKEKNFRGLLFACYQSSIKNGFHFMQTC